MNGNQVGCLKVSPSLFNIKVLKSTNIHIEDLSFSYYDEEASVHLKVLENLTLDLSSNSITVLIGQSGCGKTTLLNLIAGVLAPISGKIVFTKNGVEAKPKIGYVFQAPSLIPWRTVRDNVLLGAEIRNTLSVEVIERAEKLLIAYGLTDFVTAYPNSLSGGMQQRVSIIRAVVSGADVLLLDEPFANTDYILRRELQEDLMKIVTEQNLIAIMVTHDLIEAVKIADNIVVLTPRPASIKESFTINVNRSERMETNLIMKNELYRYIENINNVIIGLDFSHKINNA